jgi:hypothetical protein
MKTVGKMFKFLIITTWFGGWALAAAALHVVRSPETDGLPLKITLVTKERLNFADTYVDTRKWTIAEAFERHPMVTRRLFATGREHLLAHLGSVTEVQRLRTDIETATIVPVGTATPTATMSH